MVWVDLTSRRLFRSRWNRGRGLFHSLHVSTLFPLASPSKYSGKRGGNRPQYPVHTLLDAFLGSSRLVDKQTSDPFVW